MDSMPYMLVRAQLRRLQCLSCALDKSLRTKRLVSGYCDAFRLGDAVLLLPVADRRTDRVFCEDRAVDFDWGKRELLDDVGVRDREASATVLPLTHSVA